MLRPRDTATRERRSLDGLWQFALDPGGIGRGEQWWRGRLAGAVEMPVPASYNDIVPDPAFHDHVGDAWYQTTVRVPRRWVGERIVLRFDSATHRAVVWIDDTQVAEHEGGYTPFEADVTGVLHPGAEHRLTVVVDNRLTWQSIPPGKVTDTPEGPRQRYFHDFFNYAGLHRSVWLCTTPGPRISDLTVVTDLTGAQGSVDVQVDTVGAEGLDVVLTLRDAEGNEVATSVGATRSSGCPTPTPGVPARGTSTSSSPSCGSRTASSSTSTRSRSASAPWPSTGRGS